MDRAVKDPCEVIIVRAHRYGPALDVFVRDLIARSGRGVVIVADESARKLNPSRELRKITADPTQFGLFATPDMMWRCGDYFLYEALAHLPDTTFIWMIEHDLRIHTADLAGFFDGMNLGEPADFITPWFIPGDPDWPWYDSIAPYVPAVFNCMLQICRFSRPAIEFLLTERQRLSSRFPAGGKWPNDEAFVASFLHAGRFRIRTLREHAPGYTTLGTLSFTRPVSMRALEQREWDDTLYHPVLEGDAFVTRALSHLAQRAAEGATAAALRAEFGFAFQHELHIEGGAPALRNFRCALQGVLARR